MTKNMVRYYVTSVPNTPENLTGGFVMGDFDRDNDTIYLSEYGKGQAIYDLVEAIRICEFLNKGDSSDEFRVIHGGIRTSEFIKKKEVFRVIKETITKEVIF